MSISNSKPKNTPNANHNPSDPDHSMSAASLFSEESTSTQKLTQEPSEDQATSDELSFVHDAVLLQEASPPKARHTCSGRSWSPENYDLHPFDAL